jgi:hypothetical protein
MNFPTMHPRKTLQSIKANYMVSLLKKSCLVQSRYFGQFLFATILHCTLIMDAQVTQLWSNTYAGSGSRRYDKHLCFSDASGNAYGAMAYSLMDTLFVNQSGTVVQSYSPSGITFCRFASSGGSPTWTRNINDNFMSLASYRIDASANTYAAVTQTTGANNKDIRLYRFTNTGTQSTLFTYSSQNASDDEAEDMITDNQGNFLVCGSTNQQNNILVLKYSSSGTSLWNFASALSQSGTARALRVGVDAISNVYTVSANTIGTNTEYYVNAWLANGTEVFSVPVPQSSYNQLQLKDFAVDNNGNSFSVFAGINGNGTYDILIYKYDLNGSLSNTFVFPSSGNGLLANAKILPVNSSNAYFLAYQNASNNSIVCGRYTDQNATWTQTINNSSLVDIKVDQGNSLHVLSSTPGTEISDIRVTKISNTGSIQFNKTFDIAAENGEDVPTSMALQSSGLITVCGSTGNQTPSDKVFAIRVNSSGSLSWTRVLFDFTESGSGSYINPTDGSVYVSGNSRNSNNVTDMYLLKYNASGVEQWRLNFENQNIDEVTSPKLLTGDAQGNIYIAGYVNASVSSRDIIIYKINPSGIRLWKRVFNGLASSEDIPNAMVCDASGDLWLVGTSRVTALNRNILVLRYSPSGQLNQNFTIDGPLSAEDIGEDIAVEGDAVYILGEVTDIGSNKNVAVYKYNRISGNLLWTYIKDNAAGDDLGVSIKAKNGPVVAMNLFSQSGIYAGYACRLGDDINGTAVVLAEKTFSAPNVNIQLNDVDWAGTKLAVAGYRGTTSSSTAYAACFDAQNQYFWQSSSIPSSPSSFNRFLNCSLTPQGYLFCSGTIRSSSGSDRLAFATFSPDGQLVVNNLFGSATGTIDQLGSAYFQSGKAAFSGQTNPQNNNDGYQGLVSLTNFPARPDTISHQQACGGVPIQFTFNILDENPQNVVIDIQSQSPSLLPNSAISFSVNGSLVSVVITGIPDTTAIIPVVVTLNDGVSSTYNTGFAIFVTKRPASVAISGPVSVLDNSSHIYNALSTPNDSVVWQLSGNGQILSHTVDTVTLSFNEGFFYLIRTATNSCGIAVDSLMIVSQPPNQAPVLQFSDSLLACSMDTSSLSITIIDEDASSVQISLLGMDSIPVPPVFASFSGQGSSRTLHIHPGMNQFGHLNLILLATDSAGLTSASYLHVNLLTHPMFASISGPGTVLQNSTHAYFVNGLSGDELGTWNFSSGGSFTAISDTSILLTVGTQNGFLRYTISNDCAVYSDSMMIKVNSPNYPPVIYGPDSISLCGVSSTALVQFYYTDESVSSVLAAGHSSNQQLIPDSVLSTGVDTSYAHIFLQSMQNTSDTLSVYITLTDTGGLSVTKRIFVNIHPEVLANGINGPNSLMQGDSAVYSLTGLQFADQTQWTFNGNGQLTVLNDTSVLLVAGVGSGLLTCMANNACSDIETSKPIVCIAPNQAPVINLPNNQVSVCPNAQLNGISFSVSDESSSELLVTVTASDSSLISQLTSSQVDTIYTLSFVAGGYSITQPYILIQIQDTGGLTVSDTIRILILQAPAPVSISGPDSVMAQSSAEYLLSGYTSGAIFAWTYGGNPVSGTAEVLTFNPDQSEWLVYESSLNNCLVWDSLFVFVDTLGLLTSGKMEFSEARVRVYPNPVPEGRNITIEGLNSGMWVELLDVSGRRIQMAYPHTISNGYWVSEPLSGGVYLLVIGDSGHRKVQRIVVE